MNRYNLWVQTIIISALMAACATSKRIDLISSTVEQRDVFTCKGLSADNRWVGVTDVFLPDKDSRVIVVSQLAPEDKDAFVIYELTNPYDMVVITERVKYPKEQFLGVSFALDRLMKLGGEGEWRATVYSNEVPIGEQVFWVGEKIEPEDQSDESQYFVIGDSSNEVSSATESESLSEEERYSTYIQEVPPAVDIPGRDNTLKTGGKEANDTP